MATVTEPTGHNVHNNKLQKAAQGTASSLIKASQSGGSTLPQSSEPRTINKIVLKRGRPTNAEKAQKAAQRAATSVISQQTETSENIAAAALQKLGNSTLSPSDQAEQIFNNATNHFENDGGKGVPERQNKEPLLAENETLDDALMDEQKTQEIFMLAQEVFVSESIRKKSLSLELEQDQKEKERLQKKSEELDMKEKAELDKILKEREELQKEFQIVDARANKRKALDKHQDSQIRKIRAIATTVGAHMSDLKRHLQIIRAPE